MVRREREEPPCARRDGSGMSTLRPTREGHSIMTTMAKRYQCSIWLAGKTRPEEARVVLNNLWSAYLLQGNKIVSMTRVHKYKDALDRGSVVKDGSGRDEEEDSGGACRSCTCRWVSKY